MKKFILLFFQLLILMTSVGQDAKPKYFEMRTYYCNQGKRPDLIKRFQDHTLRLFEKNGIENVAYFVPTDESKNFLVFILAYPTKDLRDPLWNKFANDPQWQKAMKESEVNGPLVAKVEQVFMTLAPDLRNSIAKLTEGERIFELRTYYMHPGRVDAINARFRDHTRALFESHGMTNVAYWFTVEQDGQSKLVYILAHRSEQQAKDSWSKFRDDPEWKKVKERSELDGPIVERIETVYLKTLPFSPLQ
jgi:hypothetical protein